MWHKIEQACPARRQHLATSRHLAEAGIGTGSLSRALRSGALVRVRRNVYAPAPLPERARHLVSGGSPDPGFVADVRAALLSLGATAMAGGRTAAALWGLDMLVEPAHIDVVTASTRSAVPPHGVALRRVRRAAAVEHAVLGLAPVRTLSAADTVVDCALTRPLREAVVIADSALRTGRVTVVELQGVTSGLTHHPLGRRLRRVVDLVDPESGSVLESVLRVLLAQHELHPETQVRLADAHGLLIGRVDFLFRAERLVLECDGRRWHDPQDARERDRVRDNELERAGWRLLRVTWNDVLHRPDHVIQLVQDCLVPWQLTA